jgi:hypothetical protein
VAVRELWVHLYLNAFKNQHSVWLRETVAGARGSHTPQDWGYMDVSRFALRDEHGGAADLWPQAELHRPDDEDETDVRVPLPRDVAPGEKIAIDVAWDDKLPDVIERTGYWKRFHMVGQWFPKIARLEPEGRWAHFPFHHLAEFYSDFGTYDVTLDVPQGFTIGASGPAIDTRVEAGRRIERHVQADVHDFAWTAWDEYKSEKEVVDGVQVSILYPPGFRVQAQRELRAIRFALPWMSARFGRYPYEVLTLVHPPPRATEAGGMEYPTLITTGGRWYGPPGVYEVETVTIHELGHEWFYGLVATNEVEWPFLDEGLNTFAEETCSEAFLGPGNIIDLFGLQVGALEAAGDASSVAVHDAPVAQPAYAFAAGYDLGALVYARTGAIFGTLRRVRGDDAVRALGRYARKFRFQHPGPDDLFTVYRGLMGDQVEHTLRTALYEKGWVDYTIADITGGRARQAAGIFERDGKRETVANGTTAAGYDGSVLVMRRGTLSFPVEIDLVRADGSKERVHWDGDGTAIRIPYHGDQPLRAAIIDPDHKIVIEQDPTNDFATAPDEPLAGAPRTLERVLYWAEIAFQAVVP